MVKESKIKELVYGKVAKELENTFTKLGFKYVKTKQYFLRQADIFSQIIYLSHPYSPLQYNEVSDEIYLNFELTSRIGIPDFEKWHVDNIGKAANFSHRINNLNARIKLSFDDFEQDSFYTPTKSQEFKRNISGAFMN